MHMLFEQPNTLFAITQFEISSNSLGLKTYYTDRYVFCYEKDTQTMRSC